MMRRDEAEALQRYEDAPSTEEVRVWAEANIVPRDQISERDIAHARQFAHEMGWGL